MESRLESSIKYLFAKRIKIVQFVFDPFPGVHRPKTILFVVQNITKYVAKKIRLMKIFTLFMPFSGYLAGDMVFT